MYFIIKNETLTNKNNLHTHPLLHHYLPIKAPQPKQTKTLTIRNQYYFIQFHKTGGNIRESFCIFSSFEWDNLDNIKIKLKYDR